jgi:hypothetical protein
MRRRNLIILLLAVAVVCGWLLGPQIAVWAVAQATKKGEESSEDARDRIVLFGERSIQPTIASIEEHSPWVRRYAYLPSALEKIGGSARGDLLAAVDNQKNPDKRARLISALQTAFDDYSKLGLVIEDYEAGRISEIALVFMESDMRRVFPNAPRLLTEDRAINPAFKAYWTKRSEQDAALKGQ